jgi:DNA-binding beta-propeller fold protein YncE
VKRFTISLLTCAVAVAPALAQAPPAPQTPPPTPLWTLSGDFQSPESAFYDAASNSVFVSSINGGMTEKDGNGYISRLTPDGRMVSAKWVTGLNGPKGLRGVGGTLWAADIDEVVAIDIASGSIKSRVRVEGATFLNDLATAPDGTVYVSDSFRPAVYVVRDGKSAIFLEGADTVEQPNGLLVDGDRLILGSIGAGGRGQGGGRGRGGAGGSLYAFDLKTRMRTKLTNDNVGGIDGIEPDGRGGIIVTDVIGRRILHVPTSGQTRVLAQLSGGGADFGYIVPRSIAIVPYLTEHRVEAYDLTAALK